MRLKVQSPFSSAHFYNQPQWSEKKNRSTFGRCFTPFGHGHNYLLEVEFFTSTDSFQLERNHLQTLISELTQKLDHEHLNFVIPEFRERIPTTENIALYFLEKLKFSVDTDKIHSLKVIEMDNLWVEVKVEQ